MPSMHHALDNLIWYPKVRHCLLASWMEMEWPVVGKKAYSSKTMAFEAVPANP